MTRLSPLYFKVEVDVQQYRKPKSTDWADTGARDRWRADCALLSTSCKRIQYRDLLTRQAGDQALVKCQEASGLTTLHVQEYVYLTL